MVVVLHFARASKLVRVNGAISIRVERFEVALQLTRKGGDEYLAGLVVELRFLEIRDDRFDLGPTVGAGSVGVVMLHQLLDAVVALQPGDSGTAWWQAHDVVLHDGKCACFEKLWVWPRPCSTLVLMEKFHEVSISIVVRSNDIIIIVRAEYYNNSDKPHRETCISDVRVHAWPHAGSPRVVITLKNEATRSSYSAVTLMIKL